MSFINKQMRHFVAYNVLAFQLKSRWKQIKTRYHDFYKNEQTSI